MLILAIMAFAAACGGGTNLMLDKSQASIVLYDTIQINALVDDEIQQGATWETSDATICTVENGLVEGVGVGTATITATYDGGSATCEVSVLATNDLPVITLSQNDVEVRMGASVNVTASAVFKGRTEGIEFAWSSANSDIATVNNGVITGVHKGETTITVTANYKGAISAKDIKVVVKSEYDVLLNHNVELETEQQIGTTTHQVEVDVLKELAAVNASEYEIEFSIEEEQDIATISEDGLITAKKAGQTTAYAKVTVGEYIFNEKINVNVERSQKTFARVDFETYKSVVDNQAVANDFVIDGTGFNFEQSPVEVYVNKEKVKDGTATLSGKNLVVSGDIFGSKIYGEVSIKIITETVDFYASFNVITKKINSIEDLKNIGIYGGVDAEYYETFERVVNENGVDKTYEMKFYPHLYDGYFVLTKNLDNAYADYVKNFSHVKILKDGNNSELSSYSWEQPNFDTEHGFIGTFDGQGYVITGLNFAENNGGIFGSVGRKGTVKNLGIVATLAPSGVSYPIAQYFSGNLENCYVDVSASGASLDYSYAIAWDTTNMHAKDVVVKYNGTSGAKGYLAGYAARYNYTKYFKVYYTNVVAFVNEPAGTIPASYSFDSYIADAEWYDGLTKKDYNAEHIFNSSEGCESSYWELRDGQPVFKNVPQTVIGADFEVFSGITGTTPTHNNFTLNVGDLGVSNPTSVIVISSGGKLMFTRNNGFAVSGNTLTIDGANFGYKVSGDTTMIISGENSSVYYRFNAITKKISNIEDLKNIGIYGGISSSDTYKVYGGYFVLTQNIDGAYVDYAPNFSYYTGSMNHTTWSTPNWDTEMGFIGTFDGCGYTIKGLTIPTHNGGIFGVVSRNGVVKNVGVIAKLGNNAYPFAYRFNGTLENCYVEVSASAGATTGFSAISRESGNLRVKDTIIKYDGSTLASIEQHYVNNKTGADQKTIVANAGFISGTISPIISMSSSVSGWGTYFAANIANSYVFVKDPSAEVPVNATLTWHPHWTELELAWYVNAQATKLAYDAQFTTFEPSDNTFWEIRDGQPIFKTVSKIVEGTDFELFNGINGITPTANNFTLDLSAYGLTNPTTINVSSMGGALTLVKDTDFTVSNNVITVNGAKFGYKMWGETILTIACSNGELVYKFNVITRKISSINDLKNLGYYGGVSGTMYVYGGYFVLAQSLDNLGAAYAPNFSYYTGSISSNSWTQPNYSSDMGFIGVFDGQGYTIKGLNVTAKNGGIFGVVSEKAIVKNLGVIATLGNNSYAMAETYNGTIQNCYISVSANVGANTGYSAISRKCGKLNVKDTIIKYDGSSLATESYANGSETINVGKAGFIADTLTPIMSISSAPGGFGTYFASTFTNTYAFVKDPSADYVVNATYGYHVRCLPLAWYDTINGEANRLAYDATLKTFAPAETAHWDLTGNQPIFASAK